MTPATPSPARVNGSVPGAAVQPRICIICTAPRTGSSLLAAALADTQRIGVPQEYFDIHRKHQEGWIKRLGIRAPAEYLDKVIAAGSTPNGVFGLKLHWHQIPALRDAFASASVAERTQVATMPLDELLRTRFSQAHYVWLRRRNKIAQAISYYRAAKTDNWRVQTRARAKADAAAPPLPFDLDEIESCVRAVEEFDRQWLAFFKQRKVKALVLIYEDFVASYEATVRAVCQYVGVAGRGLPVPAQRFQKQADDVSVEWEREYLRRRPAAAAAASAPPAKAPRPRARVVARRGTPIPGAGATDDLQPAPASAPPPVAATLGPDELIAYDLNPQMGVKIVTGTPKRAWMDATGHRFAYRCLPLVIANRHGWLLLSPCRIRAVWNGADAFDSVAVEHFPADHAPIASSHFGSGILTFSTNFLFRTPPGISLLVHGPANLPKDGIYPLEGIVETDWSEATFTMNWKMLRPGQEVIFERDEPFAMLTPVVRNVIEQFRPEIRPIADNPALEAGYQAWSASRSSFNRDLRVENSDARKMGWQRHYILGETVSQKKAPDDHQTTVSVRDFVDKRP